MTAKKLIEILKTADPDAQVRLGGYYGGTITKATTTTRDSTLGAKAKSANGTQVTLYTS